MNADRVEQIAHRVSLAAIAIAVVTVVSAIWGGLHDAMWQLLASALAVFAGTRAIVALNHARGAKWSS